MDRPLLHLRCTICHVAGLVALCAGCGDGFTGISSHETAPVRLSGPADTRREPQPLTILKAMPVGYDATARDAGAPAITEEDPSAVASPAAISGLPTPSTDKGRASLTDRLRKLQEDADGEPSAPLTTPPALVAPAPARGQQPVVESHAAAEPIAEQPKLQAPLPALPLAAKPAASPLRWSDKPIRSAAMDAVTRQAREATQRGYELAARGAAFSARSEFIRALRLVAQALDAHHGTNIHGKALAAGLRALDEADDFLPRSTRVDAELNVPLLVASHQTPVLKGDSLDEVTPLVARQRYFTFAQEQLGAAAGREAAGSLALYALGKIQPALNSASDSERNAADFKSVVFYRAATMVDTGNFMAANDLGVLLARFGCWNEASVALRQALSVTPHSVTWRNLALVHRQLGEAELAERATSESTVLAAREKSSGTASAKFDVQWLDADQFAQVAASPQIDVVKTPATAAKPPATATKPPVAPRR